MKNSRLYTVILEFCGGAATDSLYEHLALWNPKYPIAVLDNCSPNHRSRYITHQNKVNTYIGGGIRDCIRLAEEAGARYLMFIANDIELVTVLRIDHLRELVESDPNIIQLGVSLTLDSDKVLNYPWMANRGNAEVREVPHCDLLCCVLQLDFVRAFGGFPDSKGGWGYDWEVAYQAKLKGKRIMITDKCAIRHIGNSEHSDFALGKQFNKGRELKETYEPRYGDFARIVSQLLTPYRAEPEVPVIAFDPLVQVETAQQAAEKSSQRSDVSERRAEFLYHQMMRRMSEGIVRQFHELYYNARFFGGTWYKTFWLGTPVQKCPLDLWVYQEIVYEVKPDVIIETGTLFGGSASFLASVCDLLNRGRVITVDTKELQNRPQHPRITYLLGSSTSQEVISQITEIITDKDNVIVILNVAS